jgi:hypothetical protein
MGVGVSVDFLAAGCPAGMCYAAGCNPSLVHDLVNYLIDTACLLDPALSILNEPAPVEDVGS